MRLDQRLIRLPIAIEIDSLVAEVSAIDEASWRPHPEGMPGNSALPLVATVGDPENDSVDGPMQPTPILQQLPAVVSIMAGLTALGCPIGRTRLMRIDLESEVRSHVDTNRYWWDHLRIHIPIVTDPSVVFHVADESVHMEPGSCWVFDTWERHRVENPANSQRIHLVIDTVGGADFWSLIDRQTGVIDPLSPLPELQPVNEIAFETRSQHTVMPASEIDMTLAAILQQFSQVDLDRAVNLDRALVPFRRSWRALLAQFGDNLGDVTAFAKLRNEVDALLEPYTDELPNTVRVNEAIRQLVIRPSLPTASPSVPPPIAAVAGPPAEAVTLDRPVFIISSPRSGSTMLFEALMRTNEAYTIGGESHQLIESFASLTPAAHDWESNRLTEADVSPEIVGKLSESFVRRLRDRDGTFVKPGDIVRMIEKTPKNSLRIPFLAAAYPDAKFVYLWRDPRETISSMLDAWRSGKFVTYPDLPGWQGDRWSLLLTPGWRELIGASLPKIVATQWATATSLLLDDLEALEPDRWCVTSYSALLADPQSELTRLCSALDLTWDTEIDGGLPLSSTTLDAPQPSKWERNAEELKTVWEIVDAVAVRAHDVFADPPPIQPSRKRSADAVQVGITEEPDGAIPADFSSVFTDTFAAILEAANCSLAVTTYQSGRLVLVRRHGTQLNTHFRFFPSPMGVAVHGAKLALGTKTMVWEFWNQQAAASAIDPEGRTDACFMPRRAHTTGDIRIHDLGYDADGELWAVATRFSCLVTFDRENSFAPQWRPQFISGISADDRCHLNGMAMVDGRPKYLTVLGMTDSPNGWRQDKAAGGAILDIDGGAPITVGLSMPHSPRWHNGKLWVLESGRGALCTVNIETGERETVAVLPGFARGLSFVGNIAFVGLSKVRETVFDGLPITNADTPRECGVWAVEIESGQILGFLRFEGSVTELFEVAILPGMQWPDLVEPGAEATNDAFVLSDEALKDVIRPADPTTESPKR